MLLLALAAKSALADCERDADCKGGRVCAANRCVERGSCTRDRDCPGDQVCDLPDRAVDVGAIFRFNDLFTHTINLNTGTGPQPFDFGGTDSRSLTIFLTFRT